MCSCYNIKFIVGLSCDAPGIMCLFFCGYRHCLLTGSFASFDCIIRSWQWLMALMDPEAVSVGMYLYSENESTFIFPVS